MVSYLASNQLEPLIDFYERILRQKATDPQKDAMRKLEDMTIKKIAGSTGRQCGKSQLAAVFALWVIFVYSRYVNRQIQILLVGTGDGSEIYRHLNDIFAVNRDEFKPFLVQAGMKGNEVPVVGFILHENRSRLRVAGSTPAQVQGKSCDILIIDEAGSIDDQTIKAAKGCLSGPIYRTIMISTPHKRKKETDYFVNTVLDPKKDGYTTFHWGKPDCPWHTPQELADNKRELSAEEYSIQVLGLPADKKTRATFNPDDIKRCRFDEIISEGGERYGAMDFGESVGLNVLGIFEKVGARWKVLYLKGWKKTPIEDILPEWKKICSQYNVLSIQADSRPQKYHDIIGENLDGIPIIYLDMTLNKEPALGQLMKVIERHHLEFNSVPLELEFYRYHPGKRSGDDLIDCLMIGIFQFEEKEPAVITFI